MESRFLLTVNISHLRSVHLASIGGLAMVATAGFMTLAIPFVLFIRSSPAWLAGAVAAAVAIRRHRNHVIGMLGDDLPMALGSQNIRSDCRP